MTLPIRIVVRTRTPWETMTRESFMAQRDPKTPGEFIRMGKGIVPQWEEATGLSFYQYRARIRDACEARLREIAPLTIGLDAIDWSGPDEALVTIDDDDLLKDSVVSVGERFTPDVNLVIWKRITNYLGTDRLENPSFGGSLDTCNWAIRKSFANRLPAPQRNAMLTRHWHAAGLLAPLFGPTAKPLTMLEQAKQSLVSTMAFELVDPSVIRIDECHSTYYLHSGSISFLCHKMGKEVDPVATIRKLPLHPVYEENRL